VQPPAAVPVTLVLSGPLTVEAGATYVLTVSASPLTGLSPGALAVDWGDGTVNYYAGLPAYVTHVYTVGPNFVAITAVASLTGASGVVFAAQELDAFVDVPQVAAQAGAVIGPGQVGTATVPGAPGITGTLFNEPGSHRVTLYVGVYGSNPTGHPLPVNTVAIYDAHVNGASDNDVLVLTFKLPPGVTQSLLQAVTALQKAGQFAQAAALLAQVVPYFYDPSTGSFVRVQGSTRFPNSLQIDLVNGTVTIIIDSTSFPSLSLLTGTVFTVSVPVVNTPAIQTTATVSPTLSLALPTDASAMTQQATFQTSTSLTLTLSPSLDSRGSAAQANLSGGGGELDDETLARLLAILRGLIVDLQGMSEPLIDRDLLQRLIKNTLQPSPATTVAEPVAPAIPAAAPEAISDDAEPDGEVRRVIALDQVFETARAPKGDSPASPSNFGILGGLALPMAGLLGAHRRIWDDNPYRRRLRGAAERARP
jgi:hypothetical protein